MLPVPSITLALAAGFVLHHAAALRSVGPVAFLLPEKRLTAAPVLLSFPLG